MKTYTAIFLTFLAGCQAHSEFFKSLDIDNQVTRFFERDHDYFLCQKMAAKSKEIHEAEGFEYREMTQYCPSLHKSHVYGEVYKNGKFIRNSFKWNGCPEEPDTFPARRLWSYGKGALNEV